MADEKVEDEIFTIPSKRGNGQLRREVWKDKATGRVTRYNLSYINHALSAVDNGRVIGYDNAHHGHHRHCFGVVEPIEFVSFDDIVDRFNQDWIAFTKRQKK